MKKIPIVKITCSLLLVLICSCVNHLDVEGLKYRSTGNQYVGDLGQAVMIERAGRNHVVPITRMKFKTTEFRGSSKKIYQMKEDSFSGSATLSPVKIGTITDTNITIGSGEEGKPNYYKKNEGSHIVMFPSQYFAFIDEVNSPDNAIARKRLREFSDKHNRAVGLITRVVRVYGHSSIKEIKGGLGVSGKYNAVGEFVSSVKFAHKSDIKLEDGSVSGYLVGRIVWDENDPYKIENVITIDYVGIDHSKFRWLNTIFVR